MKITGIVNQKRSNETYNIFVDGEFCFSASAEDILKYSIKENTELNNENLEFLIENCEVSRAYAYALYLLDKKDYTECEISRKMNKKGYSTYSINKVLEKLKLYGIINDERYVKRFINNCIEFKKYGSRKIAYELQAKGIEREIISEIKIDEDTQFRNALELALKKLKSVKGKANARDKLVRYLLSKGYEFEIIRRVMDEIKMTDEIYD